MDLKEIKNENLICKRCNKEYNNKFISLKYIEKDLNLYSTKCSKCRKYQKCKICDKEYFNKNGEETCSKKCGDENKKLGYIKSCGTKHNFSKNSKSRINWENKLLETEGIVNVFQRDKVKEKIKNTFTERYGEGIINPGQIEEVKLKVKNILIKRNGYYKPFNSNASNASMKVFSKVINYLITDKSINTYDIYYGDSNKNKNEFYLERKNNSYFFYDLTIKTKKLIIEFNGCRWHPDYRYINKLNKWYHPMTKEGYKKYLKIFEEKIQLAKLNNFKVLVIWDTESIEENYKLCIDFINENI